MRIDFHGVSCVDELSIRIKFIKHDVIWQKKNNNNMEDVIYYFYKIFSTIGIVIMWQL